MNMLPIPGLDGGHALFTVIEMVTRRKPSEKFMEYAQMAGMVLLLGLMAYALGLDFWRLFK
jgi:regulator of sigma E protease